MRIKKYTILALALMLTAMLASQGCGVFSSSGCSRSGFFSGTRVRITELITQTGCQTLRCPRVVSYEVTANSNGVINYSRDENGLCWPNSSKLTFTIVGFNLGNFTSLSGSVNLASPPPSITIGGWGMDATYGPPIVHLYDYNNRFIGQQTATAVAGDGSWATFNLEPLTNPYSGTYHARISRMRWDGNYEEIGDAPVDCYGLPLVDEDGDGVTCDWDCNDEDYNIHPLAAPDCTGIYFDANCNGRYDMMEYGCQDPGGCGPTYLQRPEYPCYEY